MLFNDNLKKKQTIKQKQKTTLFGFEIEFCLFVIFEFYGNFFVIIYPFFFFKVKTNVFDIILKISKKY